MISDATLKIKRGEITGYSTDSSSRTLEKVLDVVRKTGRRVSYFTIGLNPQMRYGYAQDRFVDGALCLDLGFSAIIREGDLKIDGKRIVDEGKPTV